MQRRVALTIHETAERLRVHPEAVAQLRKDALPGRKVGGVWRIPAKR